MKVNFIREFNAFIRYAKNNGLSARERLLWIGIFTAANDRAEGNGQTEEREWTEDLFPISNNEMNLLTGLDKRGIEETRNKLKQRGLIDFQKGFKNTASPKYKMHYLTVGCKNVPNNVPKDVPNNVPKDVPNNVPKDVPTDSPFILNKRDNEIIENQGGYSEEEESNNPIIEIRAREIAAYWEKCFGSQPSPLMRDYLADYEYRKFLQYGLIEAVIHRTALVMPENRWQYIETVLADMESKGIRHIDDISDNTFDAYFIAQKG